MKRKKSSSNLQNLSLKCQEKYLNIDTVIKNIAKKQHLRIEKEKVGLEVWLIFLF
jgi:hypothetical protein